MICINLLPEERRPVERTPLPRFLVIVGGVAGFCLEVVLLIVVVYMKIPEKQQTRESYKVRYEGARKRVEQVKGVDKEIKQIQARKDTIEKLLNDRRTWAPMLYHLTDPEIVPSTVWFKKLELKKSKTRGKPGPACLYISGLARGAHSTATVDITEFVGNLKKEPSRFSDQFTDIDLDGPIDRAKLPKVKSPYEDIPRLAASFRVKLVLKSAEAPKGKKKKKAN